MPEKGSEGRRVDQLVQLETHALPSHQDRSRRSLLKILNAAETVLCSVGVDGFSIAGVALEAGVSVGGIYRRFKRKEDLFLAIKDLALTRSDAYMGRALTERPFSNAQEVMETMLKALVTVFSQEETLHRALLQVGRGDEDISRRGRESRARTYHTFRTILIPHLRKHEDAVADSAAMMCWELAIGTVLNKVTSQSPRLRALSWQAFQHEMLRVLSGYLAALPVVSNSEPASRPARRARKGVVRPTGV